MITNMYTIKINDTVTVELTGKELADLHERLTTVYNENYDAITSDEEGTF